MRIVPTNCVIGEAYLAKNLYSSTGNTLLKKGTKLTDQLLRRIEENNIFTIYIDDGYSDKEIEDLVRPELRNRAVQALKDTFSFIEKSNALDKKLDLGLRKNLMIKSMEKYIQNLKAVSEMIIEELSTNHQLMINLVDIKNLDNYTYEHSLSVAVMSLIVGLELKMNHKELSQLFLGALLHDVGKSLLPKELLTKTSAYTPDEIDLIKTHPTLGFEYLKENYSFSTSCKMSVLQHHERFDSTGYPKGLSGFIIHRHAKIIAIVDAYDSMTSDTYQSRALPPNEAIEFIMGSCGSQFDIELATIFTHKIVPYPEGTIVKLSNITYGVVVQVNIDFPMRPKVRILEKNIPTENMKVIDLMTSTNITILGIQYVVPK